MSAMTYSTTSSRKPAFRMICLITSTHEAKATLGLCGTSLHEAEPAG